MADIAKIGIEVDTDEVKDARNDLNELVPAANNAEKAAGKLTDRFLKMGDTLSGKVIGALSGLKGALVGLVAGFVGGLSFDGLADTFMRVAERLDDVSKAASKLKVDTAGLQALAYAGDLAGVSFDQLTSIANKMNRVIGTAVAKGKENEGVFKMLGISAKELSDMPIDERFAAIADRMNSMNLTAEQTATILGMLGDRSGALAALLEGGSEAIREAREQLERFGGIITPEQGKDIEAMNDAFTTLQYAIQAAGNQFVVFVAQSGLTTIVNGLAEVVGWLNRVGAITGIVKTVFNTLTSALNPFYAGIKGLSDLFQSVFGVSLSTAVKAGANFILNAFSAAYQSVGVIWDALPSLLGSAAIGAVNFVIKELNRLVAASINAINAIAGAIPDWMGGGQGGLTIDPNKWKAPMLQDPYAKDTQAAFDSVGTIWKNTMAVDNFAAVATATEDVDKKAKNAIPNVAGLGNALEKSGNQAGGAVQQLTALQKIGEELDKLGAPFEQAKSAFDKLEELKKNGIVTGDQYTSMLQRIQQAFIATGGTAEQWSKIVAAKTNEMGAALKDFATNSLTSVGDTLADLAVDGKADFKALADGIIKDLIRMMWQALIVKPIIGGLFGFESGGVFGSGATPFAKGSAFTNGVYASPTFFAFANGGSFSRGVMGEAGPEAVVPLKRGVDGSLGVEAHGMNGGGGGRTLVIDMSGMQINVEPSGDPDQDRKTAAVYAEAMEERMRMIANEQIGATMQYGGAGNRRGF